MTRGMRHLNCFSNNNQIPEFSHTIRWQRETGIFTQRGRHPIPLVRVCLGTHYGQSVSRNNHDHGLMGKKRLSRLYSHPGQHHQQWNQYLYNKQASFLYNIRNINWLPHTRTGQQRTIKFEPTQTRTITYNFLSLATALKCSPRKEIPLHWSYNLSINTAIWCDYFPPWSRFPRISGYLGGRVSF